jgi:hypothetical protein
MLMFFLILPIRLIELREDIMIRITEASAAMFVLILFAVPCFANDPLQVELVSYPFTGSTGSISQVQMEKSFELNLDKPIIKNTQTERINMMSERNQKNRNLYRYTEKPSDYMHAVQQGYVPW